MLEAALFDLNRIPSNPLLFGFDFFAGEIGDADTVTRHHGNLAIGEEENVARMFENRGHVGRNKKFLVAHTHHDRGALPRRNNRVGIISRDNRQRKNTAQALYRLANGGFKVYTVL